MQASAELHRGPGSYTGPGISEVWEQLTRSGSKAHVRRREFGSTRNRAQTEVKEIGSFKPERSDPVSVGRKMKDGTRGRQ